MTPADVLAGRQAFAVEHTTALDLLAALPDQSIDGVVTDPPYGISFMGKEWDTFNPEKVAARAARKARKTTSPPPGHGDAHSGGWIEYDLSSEGNRRFQAWCEEWAREVRRVLKPGGHMLAFGSPRTHHRLQSGIEDAGLEIRDCLHWIHGSGFPKSLNVERAIAVQTCPTGGRHHRFERDLHERERKGELRPDDHVCPTTAESEPWSGWGSALKPAYEPITLSRAPLGGNGSIAPNVRTHGTGALNVADSRIYTLGSEGQDYVRRRLAAGGSINRSAAWHAETEYHGQTPDGRFPTNLLFSHHPDCEPRGPIDVAGDGHYPSSRRKSYTLGASGLNGQTGLNERHRSTETVLVWSCAPGCPVAELDRQSGIRRPSGRVSGDEPSQQFGANGIYKPGWARVATEPYVDRGGASRFYPTFAYDLDLDLASFLFCAKARRGERDFGLEALADATMRRVNAGGLEHDPRWAPIQVKNAHPTVKPLALILWLVRLICRPGAVVLDLFVGSGTTGVAALLAGCRFIGCDREESHAELARARIAGRHGPLFAHA
jgi:site-specific DNA-methyltransferase (adenine-specific)